MKIVKIKDKYYMTKVKDVDVSFPSQLNVNSDALQEFVDALENCIKNNESKQMIDILYTKTQDMLNKFSRAALEVEMSYKTFVPYVKTQKQRFEKLEKQIKALFK